MEGSQDVPDNISGIESEFKEIDSGSKWPVLYQQIRNQCLKYEYCVNEARKTQNKNLNRYRDVSPYDHSRVVLGEGSCDYINASLIQMEKAHRKYILTQGPLPHTTGHFWLMVWEQNCRAVLMLNRVIEKNQVKCHQYWPLGGEPLDLDDVGFRVETLPDQEKGSSCAGYALRTLRLTRLRTGESREVLHFHYTTWPDFGVPQSPTAFLNFLLHVRRSGALNQNVGPPVVHCSAGIGRSGTFCLVDSCLVLIDESENEPVDVKEVLLEMRRFRMGLIQTPDQLRFSYQAIIEGAKFLSTHSEDEDIPVAAVVNNHHEGSGDSLEGGDLSESDSDQSSEGGPPPLPPPRHESLTGVRMLPSLPDGSPEEEEDQPLCPGQDPAPPDRPLPSEPPLGLHNNADNDHDLRRRKRQEDIDRISEKVRSMRKKQQESEVWRQLRRSLFKPLTIGLGLVLLGGGAYVVMRWYSAC